MSMCIDAPDDESAIRQPTDNIPPRDVIRTFMATRISRRYTLVLKARLFGRDADLLSGTNLDARSAGRSPNHMDVVSQSRPWTVASRLRKCLVRMLTTAPNVRRNPALGSALRTYYHSAQYAEYRYCALGPTRLPRLTSFGFTGIGNQSHRTLCL